MKEKSKYHIYDIVNIIVFYCVFLTFFISLIIGIVGLIRGQVSATRVIYMAALTIAMSIPYLIKKIFKITFSRIVSIVFYVYMFLAGFLGVVLELYRKVAGWDMIIHFVMGAVLAVLSIYILNYTIYKKDKSRHNLFFTFLFMIIFAMGIGAIWEIIEFIGDGLFNMGYQRYITYEGIVLYGRGALMDTMLDLCMDFLGAISGVLFVYIILQLNGRFLKTFNIKKLKYKEQEVEDIEE